MGDAQDAAAGELNSAYQAHVAAARQAGATPANFNDWQFQNDVTGLAASLLNDYDAMHMQATGQHLPASARSVIYNNLMHASPDALRQIVPVWKAAQGDISQLYTTNYLDYQKYNSLLRSRGDVSPLLKTAMANARKQLGNMVGFVDQAIYDATGGTVGSTSRSGGSSAAPSLTPQQSAQENLKYSLAAAYQRKFGKAPSDAQINQMMGMNETDLNNYYNNQPYKMGLTYGQWTVAESNISSAYMKYFGRNATDQEIAWANGKSQDDINSHIMDSPSRVDGLKMGQYLNYKQALDGEATKAFGYAAPDELIKEFHTAQMKPQ